MLTKDEVYDRLRIISDLHVEGLPELVDVAQYPDGDAIAVSDSQNTWVLDGDARKSFLKHVGLSNNLANRLSNSTVSNVLTELYMQKGASSLVVHGDNVLSVGQSGRFVSVHCDNVLGAVDAAIDNVSFNHVSIMPNYDVRIEMVGETRQEVTKGDFIRGGVMLKYNPLGITDPVVQAYGLRLICMNGAVSNTVFDTYSLAGSPTADDIEEWLTSQVRVAYESLPDTIARYKTLSNDVIEPSDRALLIEGLVKRAGLRGSDVKALWAKATEEPPQTAYDIMNLMTWVTSHYMLDASSIARAQSAVAAFVEEEAHNKICPTCNRIGE